MQFLPASSKQFTANVQYKVDQNSQTKERKIVKFRCKIRFRTLHIFWDEFFFQTFQRISNEHISKKNKNRKIDSSFVSEHCATFWTRNPIWPLLRGRGNGCACRGHFPIMDMQTPPPLTFDQPLMDDGECAVWYGKNNEKILRFIFFELSSKIGVMTLQKMTLKWL